MYLKQIDQNIYSKNNLKKINCTAVLVLEDGKIFKGFGLGFERLVQFVTGMSNIRDVIPFPRYPSHVEF